MTHLAWCDPSRCSLPVHEGGAEAHRSAPIRFGAHEGYLYQIYSAADRPGSDRVTRACPQYFLTGDLNVAVEDLRLLVALIGELSARTYSPPELAKVAAALLSPDEETQ